MKISKSIDEIIDDLNEKVANEIPISPEEWMTSASYINLLSVQEFNKLVTFQSTVSKIKRGFIDLGNSNADARDRTEATDEYRDMKLQENRVTMIKESIRLAKKWADISVNLGA